MWQRNHVAPSSSPLLCRSWPPLWRCRRRAAPSSPCAWAARCVISAINTVLHACENTGDSRVTQQCWASCSLHSKHGIHSGQNQQIPGLTALCCISACLPQDAASEEDCTPDGRLPAAAAPFPAGEGEHRPAGLSEVKGPGRAQRAAQHASSSSAWTAVAMAWANQAAHLTPPVPLLPCPATLVWRSHPRAAPAQRVLPHGPERPGDCGAQRRAHPGPR